MTRVEGVGTAVVASMLLVFLGLLCVTPAYWLDLRSLHVNDSRAGQDAPIDYDREFFRDFQGAWSVSVWRFERGQWMAWCNVPGEWPYKAGKPEAKKTWGWLVERDPDCANLPPGIYQAEVRITANPGSLIARTDAILSNAFEVRP